MLMRPQVYSVELGGLTVVLHGVPMVSWIDAACAAATPTVRGDLAGEFQRHLALALVHAGVHDADAFKRARLALGLSVQRAADALDATADAVSAWEEGETPVDQDAYATLAAMLCERMDDPLTPEAHLQRMASPPPAQVDLEWTLTSDRMSSTSWLAMV